MTKLNEKEINSSLKNLNDWSFDSGGAYGHIFRTYVFSDFLESIFFVNKVGKIAEEAGHHPDISIKWNKVTLDLSTHDKGGVTEKDIKLAKSFDEIFI